MNTDKKNQHYIPKFYLRNFSYYGNSKQIGIFNLNNSVFVQTAKLKTQGSKAFFYGYDGVIEDKLSHIEGHLSTIIRDIINTQKLPSKNSKSHIDLLTFVGLTDLRNPVSIQNIIESGLALKARVSEIDPGFDFDAFMPLINHEDAVTLALSGMPDIINNIVDLDYKLLINKTPKPFISSDFPIIKYNQFLEGKKWQHGKTGYGNVGLQIFIPLNPGIMLVFYDAAVYKLGFKKRNYHELIEESDIYQLNMLQLLNCIDTIYFNENISKLYVTDLHEKSKKFIKANQMHSSSSYLIKSNEDIASDDNEKKKNLIILGSSECLTKLNINGLKMHSGAANIKFNNSVSILRPLAKRIMEARYKNR